MLRARPGIPLLAVRLPNRPPAPSGRCCLSSKTPPPSAQPTFPSTDSSVESLQLNLHGVNRMRKAVDSVCQDLLDLSSFLKDANAQRQHLLDQSNNLQQQIMRGKADKSIKARQNDIKSYIQTLDRKIRDARQIEVPISSSFVHLKRLHGRLPLGKPRLRNSNAHGPEASRQVTSALKALLALPGPPLLEELAHFLLSVPLPLSEESFLLIIRRLSNHRLASAARSVYHNLMATDYYPVSASSISVLLKITTSAQLRAEFQRLESLLGSLHLPSDEYVHSSLVTGNLKLNYKSMALNQFSKMIFSGYEPSLEVLTALVYHSAARRHWKLGCQFWRAIVEGKKNGKFGIDAWAYHAIWKLCMRCRQPRSASQILGDAVQQGYHVDDVINHRRPKHKSLPIRSSNKTPTAQDVLHAFKSRSERELPVVSKAQALTRSSLLSKLTARLPSSSTPPKPVNPLAETLPPPGPSPSLQARRKLDAIFLNKTRKVPGSLSNILCLNEPEVPIPAEQQSYSPSVGSIVFNLDEEMLRDVVQEKAGMEVSDWFIVRDEVGPFLPESKIATLPFRDPVPILWDDRLPNRRSPHPRLLFRRRNVKRVII
jgi:hypothetical protein